MWFEAVLSVKQRVLKMKVACPRGIAVLRKKYTQKKREDAFEDTRTRYSNRVNLVLVSSEDGFEDTENGVKNERVLEREKMGVSRTRLSC